MNWLEALGYLGSALILVSMLMKSVIKLRIINLIGSVIFTAYAVLIGSWPTAIMNFCLVIINIYYLIKLGKPVRTFHVFEDVTDSAIAGYMLDTFRDDIAKNYPGFTRETIASAEGARLFVIMQGSDAAGLFACAPDGDVILDYASPAYRDCSVGNALFSFLPGKGITSLCWRSAEQYPYLKRMNCEFAPDGSARMNLAG